jgi:glycosyltransferase involved in cell wall biosynthesis
MEAVYPSKVLISGGREIGGVRSFAEGLRVGFTELGIPAEILPPSRIFHSWRELRDPRILKILSTSAVFAAPFARRAICIAHGVPQANSQGWRTLAAIIASFKLANLCPGAQIISVSHYTAASLQAIFNVRSDAVIHNPVKPLYLEPDDGPSHERCYVTYVGRLTIAKNLHRILPAVRDLLDETPNLRMCIIGEGEERSRLEALIDGDARFEFKGTPDDISVRDWLRRTRIFVSGNVAEGFGITYLEALTQGCIVVMPASGGGLEISPENVGRSVQLLPLSLGRGEILATLRRALCEPSNPVRTESFKAGEVVGSYLRADARFSLDGRAAHSVSAVSGAPLHGGSH